MLNSSVDLQKRGVYAGYLFCQDDDASKCQIMPVDGIAEAKRRQEEGVPFAGVIYSHQLRITIGRCVNELELIAKASEARELANRVEYLPL